MIARRSRSWCIRSAIRSTRSLTGSCATPVSLRTPCRTPSCSAGAGSQSWDAGEVRGLDPSHPRPRLLRRIEAGASWSANVRVLPIDGHRRPDHGAVADRDELERAFRQLTVDQRAIFVLHHYLGLPLVEVAELLEHPRGHGPITIPLRDTRAPRRLDGRTGADHPRRTSRMTDDRSLERAARSWLEAGPTQAPDRAVEAALLPINTTRRSGICGSRGGCPTCPLPSASPRPP